MLEIIDERHHFLNLLTIIQGQKLAFFMLLYYHSCYFFYACLNSTCVSLKDDSPSSTTDLINQPFTRLYDCCWLMGHQFKKQPEANSQAHRIMELQRISVIEAWASLIKTILLSALKCVLWQEWWEREMGYFPFYKAWQKMDCVVRRVVPPHPPHPFLLAREVLQNGNKARMVCFDHVGVCWLFQ